MKILVSYHSESIRSETALRKVLNNTKIVRNTGMISIFRYAAGFIDFLRTSRTYRFFSNNVQKFMIIGKLVLWVQLTVLIFQ